MRESAEVECAHTAQRACETSQEPARRARDPQPRHQGQLVYDRRAALGLSQAERCGMRQPQISRIEGGGTMPTIPLLRRLARALDGDLTIELGPVPSTRSPPQQRQRAK
ncbi:helix-turn-helix domain-containing protein [Streptomyces gossypii]|uniref:helix-turn-helix domain-containing protein n=1 Tax=Streptomyces gossypii TaxID=2883101 RepID=UPI0035CD2E33